MVLMLEAAQRQGRYRQSMHRAVNAYKLLIIALDHGFFGFFVAAHSFCSSFLTIGKG